jgi:hypothetical protein
MQWNRSIVFITTSAGGKITFPILHLILFSTSKRVNFNEVENLKSDSSQTWLSMNPHCLIILILRRRSETIDTQQMVWCLNVHVPKCTLTYWKLFSSKSIYSVVYTKEYIPFKSYSDIQSLLRGHMSNIMFQHFYEMTKCYKYQKGSSQKAKIQELIFLRFPSSK